jgi:hypothetical protein
MKKNLFILAGLFLCVYSYGQGEIDALRFSRIELSGTARGQAMGGAFGALGGDVTGIVINPAGIGVYRSSELSGTLSLNAINSESVWQQNPPAKSDKINFNLGNISYAGYYPVGDENLQSINFGFSYNKIKNFNRNYAAKGKDMKTSLTDYIENITNGTLNSKLSASGAYDDPDVKWLSILGWDAGLINAAKDANDKYESILLPGESADPALNVSEKGYIDNYDFTVGMNFSNTFYFGATLSWVDIYYRMDSRYSENFGIDNYRLDNYLQTEGSGYRLNLGAIWRPTDELRLGIAYHSPTWYVMRDFYRASVNSSLNWSDGTKIAPTNTPDGNFEYRFSTPHKWVFSAAAVLATTTIVSVDYEITNYKGMNLASQYGHDFRDNEYIDTDFRLASTVRAGLEYRFTPRFSGRLGYSWMQHPYEQKFKDNQTQVVTAGTVPHYAIEGDVNYFTGGVGYRFTPNFYIDVALVYRTQMEDLYFFPYMETNRPNYDKAQADNPYISYYPQASSFKSTSFNGLVTLGYKF